MLPFALCHCQRECLSGILCKMLGACDLAVPSSYRSDHSSCIWETRLQAWDAGSAELKVMSMTSKPRNFICNVKLVVHCMWHQLDPAIRHLVRPWGPSTCALRVCDGQLAVQLLAQLTYGASWSSIVQTMHQKVKGALALTLNKCVRSPGVPLTIGQQIRQIICSFPN